MMKHKPVLCPLLAMMLLAAVFMASCTIDGYKENTDDKDLLEVGTIAPDFLFLLMKENGRRYA